MRSYSPYGYRAYDILDALPLVGVSAPQSAAISAAPNNGQALPTVINQSSSAETVESPVISREQVTTAAVTGQAQAASDLSLFLDRIDQNNAERRAASAPKSTGLMQTSIGVAAFIIFVAIAVR